MHKYLRIPVAIATSLWWISASLSFPVWAASNLQAPQDYDDLCRAERLFFGKVDTTDTYQRRLDFLEMGIFGRVRSGSPEKRFQRIADALGLELTANSIPLANSSGQVAATSQASDPKNGSFPDLKSGEKSTQTGATADAQTALPGLNDNFMHSTDATAGSASSLKDLMSSPQIPASKGSSDSTSATAATSEQKASTQSKVSSSSKPAGASSPSSTSSSTTSQAGTKSGLSSTAMTGKNNKIPTVVLGKETPKIAVSSPQNVGSHNASSLKSGHRLERPSVDSQRGGSREVEIDALFKQGMDAFRAHRSKEAQAAFKQILTLDPRNVDAYFNLGSLAEGDKEYLDALTYYKAALSSNPNDKDLKKAVASMEQMLTKPRAKPAGTGAHTPATAGNSGRPNSAPQNTTSTTKSSGGADGGVRYAPTSDAPMGSAPIIPADQITAPITDIGTKEAPLVPVKQLDPRTFSLQTAQNGLNAPFNPMNAANAPYQTPPIYSIPPTFSGVVPANNFPANNFPVGSIAPANPNRTNFGYIIQAGAGIALHGSSLHCPICRIMSGLH
ncbi:MAG TPA: tetratricopeptide repeat protein [Oculatellaceae cyanobacterium]